MFPSIEEINKIKQIPIEGMLPVLANRWSPRSFKDTPIPSRQIKIILEAARWTASSNNEQPWRFLIGTKGSETHEKIFGTLLGLNQTWARKPYLLILGTALLKSSTGDHNHYASYDLGQASWSIVVQASALGLMCHSLGGFDHDAARRAFNLTEDYVVGAIIAIGQQDKPDALGTEVAQQREIAARERKPLSQIAFTTRDTPFKI
jgi:nitroreductase